MITSKGIIRREAVRKVIIGAIYSANDAGKILPLDIAVAVQSALEAANLLVKRLPKQDS